tara:strand:+ start:25680 stop:26153 length:474 start_codon:yes stop_codon:yes gene_type:complete
MEIIKVIKSTLEHVKDLQGDLRPADILEVERSSKHSADYCLEKGFRDSYKCWTITLNDKSMAIFGINTPSLMSDVGVPWMLGRSGLFEISSIRKKVLSQSKFYIREMSKGFKTMENYIDIDNKVSIKWLKFCGFSFDAPIKYGNNDELFQRFHKGEV